MNERPIIFSGPMVRALLAGSKTMTRRVVKPQPDGTRPVMIYWRGGKSWDGSQFENVTPPWGKVNRRGQIEFPRLWVRENFYQFGGPIEYAADEGAPSFDRKMTPSIHMPRWASRITLEVIGVRVERLQDISADDAISEGISKRSRTTPYPWRVYAIEDYAKLWDSINAKRAPWASNPFVWVVSFRRLP